MVDIAIMPLAIGRRHQHRDIFAQNVAFGILEHGLRGGAERHDVTLPVDDDQRIGHGAQDRRQQRLFEAVRLPVQSVCLVIRYSHRGTMQSFQCASKSGMRVSRSRARVTPPKIISRMRPWP